MLQETIFGSFVFLAPQVALGHFYHGVFSQYPRGQACAVALVHSLEADVGGNDRGASVHQSGAEQIKQCRRGELGQKFGSQIVYDKQIGFLGVRLYALRLLRLLGVAFAEPHVFQKLAQLVGGLIVHGFSRLQRPVADAA